MLNNNNNQTLVPKLWGQLYKLNRLVKVGHMYFNHSLSQAWKKESCGKLLAKVKFSHSIIKRSTCMLNKWMI